MDLKPYDSITLGENFWNNRTEVLQEECCQACADDGDCKMVHLNTETLQCSFLDRTDYDMNPIDDSTVSFFATGCSTHWQVADKISHCRESCKDSYSDWTSTTRKKLFEDSPLGTKTWVIECECSTCNDCGQIMIVRDNDAYSVGWDAFIIFAIQMGSFSLFTFQFIHFFVKGTKGGCCKQTQKDLYDNMKMGMMTVRGRPPYPVLPCVNASSDFNTFFALWGVFATVRSCMFLYVIPILGMHPQLRVNFQTNSTHNWAVASCILFSASIEFTFASYTLLALLADQGTVKQRSSSYKLMASSVGWLASAAVLWEMCRYTHTYFFMGFLCAFLYCASLTSPFHDFKHRSVA